MTSTIKVNTIQNTCGADIIKESSNTITIGASGDTVALASGASQTGFGATGAVSWQTSVKTSTFTAVAGEGYFVNTTGGAITVNLPAGVAGATIGIKDYLNTFDTNNVTVAPNGSDKIAGDNTADGVLDTEGTSVIFTFIDSTRGWLVTSSGLTDDLPTTKFITATGGTITTVCTNFKVHTFTSPGTFCISCAGNAAGSNKLAYTVVAGGGGSGGAHDSPCNRAGGAGGAGGFREGKCSSHSYTASPIATTGLTASAGAFPITVGAGGTGGIRSSGTAATNGSTSVFSSITSAGGGSGGTGIGGPNGISGNGADGGSGGGGSGGGAGTTSVHGDGNTPPVSPPQGNDGGPGVGPHGASGGGGGATAAGVTGCASDGGAGGAGATSSINGTPTARAGGGGGGGASGGGASGGTGGGGAGGASNVKGTAGTVNTGGGAGAPGFGPQSQCAAKGAAGGSGIVIIRYKFQ